jgi:hypothetical protein
MSRLRLLILALVVLSLTAVRPRRPGGGGDGGDGPSGRPRDGDADGPGGRTRPRVAPVSDMEGAFTQVETRLTAGTPGGQAGTGTPGRQPGPGAQVQNAGQWQHPPAARTYHTPFNAEYEAYVRQQAGGPNDGTEYLVQHDGEQAFFDATEVQDRDGTPTEVLLDAKGRYEQFVDPETGEFREWWAESERSGLPKELDQAERQVRVANGKPVEWRCAEQATADAFNEAFRNNPNLRGRIVAVYQPPP